ncbi:hypothetical protein [Aliarcobacter butzleri]|uniref:Uncharacterized protein n=1 Tax=Aliarcobacter butzleri L355 TaxID=1447263 RepID=A0A0G9KY46_9BACT|nr:hypothetical protein [Aliarcobacter butzleri]KLE11426.1 hypothetical protein AF80_01715 [Aliarcobacter butzleri L355]MDH1976914.1 hypothetical protein [Aliarcobacter butzleri]
MSIYDKEILELKKEIIVEVINELKNIKNFKIKANTKAYSELNKTISKWDLEINKIENNINSSNLNENYSFLKIERKTLESLINLNNRLKFGTLSELLESLTFNYEDVFSKDTLIEIKPFSFKKQIQLNLNNTNLYICEIIEESFDISVNDKILYKIEDILIYDNKEYLETKNLKRYPIGNEIFWISNNLTLADIDKFNSLYFY